MPLRKRSQEKFRQRREALEKLSQRKQRTPSGSLGTESEEESDEDIAFVVSRKREASLEEDDDLIEDYEEEEEGFSYGLYCSLCGQIRPEDDFSAQQKKCPIDKKRFCLKHSTGDRPNMFVESLKAEAKATQLRAKQEEQRERKRNKLPRKKGEEKTIIPMGKHKGKTYELVERNFPYYCEWLVKELKSGRDLHPELRKFATFLEKEPLTAHSDEEEGLGGFIVGSSDEDAIGEDEASTGEDSEVSLSEEDKEKQDESRSQSEDSDVIPVEKLSTKQRGTPRKTRTESSRGRRICKPNESALEMLQELREKRKRSLSTIGSPKSSPSRRKLVIAEDSD